MRLHISIRGCVSVCLCVFPSIGHMLFLVLKIGYPSGACVHACICVCMCVYARMMRMHLLFVYQIVHFMTWDFFYFPLHCMEHSLRVMFASWPIICIISCVLYYMFCSILHQWNQFHKWDKVWNAGIWSQYSTGSSRNPNPTPKLQRKTNFVPQSELPMSCQCLMAT